MEKEGLESKKEQLAGEFKEASQDTERNAEIELWDNLIGDEIWEISNL